MAKDAITFRNVWQHATVSQRLTLVDGVAHGAGDGSILVFYHNGYFPSQRFPMVDGHFKALVYAECGTNQMMFVTESTRPPCRQELVLVYQPVLEDPPVHFALILGKDSPGTFDAPPYKRSQGTDLGTAVKKLRLAAYMMSAFTQEQMNRNDEGFRSFRPYEEFEQCTLSSRDQQSQRSTVHVHIVRSDRTVAEIRDPDRAQQNPNAKHAGDLFGIAADALQKYGGPFGTGKFVQAACIFVDGHWDAQKNLLVGHAALGGNVNNIRLAIFGSQAMWAWPSTVEEIPTAFLDETRTDTKYVSNDANQSGSAYEALNIGQGAFMHEVGHLLGCPHEPSGVMLRGYLNWNRSFMATEGFNVRENKHRLRVIQPADEDFWNRLDIVRFRYHPSFRLPEEPHLISSSKPLVYPLANGFMARAAQGIYMVDIHADGNSRGHIEYSKLPSEVVLTLDEIRDRIESRYRNGAIEIHVHAPIMEQVEIHDVSKFVSVFGSGSVLQSSMIGREDGEKKTVRFLNEPLKEVTVFAGSCFDALELTYASGRRLLFGNENHGGSPYRFQLEDGNVLLGLMIRGGYWIDAAGITTEKYETTEYGGPGGGRARLVAPPGHRIAGLTGWFQNWCRGVAILYEKE